MPTDRAPTRAEVSRALRTLERYGRLGIAGIEVRSARPEPVQPRSSQEDSHREGDGDDAA